MIWFLIFICSFVFVLIYFALFRLAACRNNNPCGVAHYCLLHLFVLFSGVSTVIEVELTDETMPFTSFFDSAANPHRHSWQSLVVKDSNNNLGGTWTMVYDEGKVNKSLQNACMHACMQRG